MVERKKISHNADILRICAFLVCEVYCHWRACGIFFSISHSMENNINIKLCLLSAPICCHQHTFSPLSYSGPAAAL